MAELEVDQSNLPRVQEVCQCFAVLEDGALAHNLQEQEIEQYYNSNVQRSHLVQGDIRVAKRLQDEEEQRAQMLQHQTTRQLEERDSEYARMIQEEIQRRSDEARRREVEDEEIAKRIQEEEELYLRQRSSYQHKDGRVAFLEKASYVNCFTLHPSISNHFSNPLLYVCMVGFTKESTSIPARPYLPRPVHVPHNRSPTRRWQHSSSPTYSDSEEDLIEYSRPTVKRQDSKPPVGQRRLIGRPSEAHSEQDDKSMTSQGSSNRSSHLSGGWGDVIKLIKNDMSEQGYLSHSSDDDLFEPVYKLEKILRQKQQVSGTGLSRHSSMREDRNRMWQGDGCGLRESFRERHVHFLDERKRSNSYLANGFRTYENGHRDTRERVQCSVGMSREDHTQLKETQGLHTQAQGFRRNISMRRSYHGNIRQTSTEQGSSPLRRDCPIGDFKAAQVAQDERQRLDSNGLQSPVDDFTPDNQHPSHVSMTVQPQAIRNIAEELDPTFQRKDAAESDSCQNQTSQQVGLYSPLEEPTFVPPTKRHSDKLGRVKPKEKKENAKQKDNCKQQ
ncbi:hypothetical protein cypCar_00000608 [Cyprinus carpio]|nr:hypothetical protein cypCar_00000608 [Cyprinus carpio]